jgi:hypothetical protein
VRARTKLISTAGVVAGAVALACLLLEAAPKRKVPTLSNSSNPAPSAPRQPPLHPKWPEARCGKVQNLRHERTSVEEFAANPPPVPLVFVVAAGAGQVEQDSAETGLSEMSLHNVLMGWCLNLLGLLSVSFGFHRVHQQSERNLTGGGGRATRRANTLENLALAHKSRKARQLFSARSGAPMSNRSPLRRALTRLRSNRGPPVSL